MKKYFWKDKTGRDFTNTFSATALIGAFSEEEDTNWDGETIGEWLEMEPEVGDVWENETSKVTRIE
jgi:hypothetical protein